MLRRFIWEDPNWPALQTDLALLGPSLDGAIYDQGSVTGAIRALAQNDRTRVEIDALSETALETSEIEGEHISADSVRASLARRLRLPTSAEQSARDPRADGVVELTVDATRNANAPLTAERLWAWQSGLLPDAPRSLTVGAWRNSADDPMQVVSGPVDQRVVHFEAPPANRVPREMDTFLAWTEQPEQRSTLVTAAIAHLWFVTIHPFADGNGRIARAIADLVLAREEKQVAPYVSLSRQIRKERAAYYEALERAQRGTLDVTQWVSWFIDCYRRATNDTLEAVDDLVRAAAFWREHGEIDFNARQRRVLERYLAGGFQGWLNSRKYSAIAKTSPDTAQRDLADLVHKGIIVPNEGRARKTSYRMQSTYDPNERDDA
jgi:Fic family protein